MSIVIFSHTDCLKHDMGPLHPESPNRLKAIQEALLQSDFAKELIFKESPLASKRDLIRVHNLDYVEKIFSLAPQSGYVPLDPDTGMNAYTLSAALHASGALIAAVDEVFSGKNHRVFCLVRPPGHHAEPESAMGFCFFNNVAVGVAYALEKYNLERIAIVDFDVHHGNGTETMFLREPKVCFWSSFQHPFYPGTSLQGKPSHIHLCPLSAGTGSLIFQQKITLELVPVLEAFQPECIFISAGFDAHRFDPLANLMLTEEDYAFVTQKLVEISEKYAKGRIISTLEGGYDLKALPRSVIAHLKALI